MTKNLPKKLVLLVFALLGGSLGGIWLPIISRTLNIPILNHTVINVAIGAIIFIFLSFILFNHIMKLIDSVERLIEKKSPSYILFGSIGIILGLVIGTLVNTIFEYIKIPGISEVLPVIILIVSGYLGFRIGTRKPENWRKIAQQLKPQKIDTQQNTQLLDRKVDENFRRYKILDTSVIIDGRIADVVATHFIEGTLIVPLFVVHELQYIADSSDSLKRSKGRRGLDILNQLQKSDIIAVEIYEGDFEEVSEVDSKLVKLAKQYDGIVVTNDYNLNKVCEFQNVPVLNINELANALKPVVLPGELLVVHVVKEGTERHQGVAYLEDGTMIVIEDGKHYINSTLEVVITSMLQTAAGRMIFAKPSHSQHRMVKDSSHVK